jgi:hypothetical protein
MLLNNELMQDLYYEAKAWDEIKDLPLSNRLNVFCDLYEYDLQNKDFDLALTRYKSCELSYMKVLNTYKDLSLFEEFLEEQDII